MHGVRCNIGLSALQWLCISSYSLRALSGTVALTANSAGHSALCAVALGRSVPTMADTGSEARNAIWLPGRCAAVPGLPSRAGPSMPRVAVELGAYHLHRQQGIKHLC